MESLFENENLFKGKDSTKVKRTTIKPSTPSTIKPKKFQLFLLKFRWTPNHCSNKETTKCGNNWEYIGLLPSYNSGFTPTNCPGPDFDVCMVSKLKNQMCKFGSTSEEKKFPDYWEKEFNNYGKCARLNPKIPTEYEYFKFAIEKSHEISRELNKIDYSKLKTRIGNDHEFSTAKFHESVMTSLEHKAMFSCKNYKKDSADIDEINICLNDNLEAIDCKVKDKDCRDYIRFPSTKFENLQIQIPENYLILSLQWIPTKCQFIDSKNCKDQWGIHGLWPTRSDGSSPMNCPGKVFDECLITENLEMDMCKFWPSIGGKKVSDFWKHEYDKHGICALSIPKLSTQNTYLRETIDLFVHYATILKLLKFKNLKRINIDEYKTEEVRNLIEGSSGINRTVTFVCKIDSIDISEIRICLDHQLKIIDCRKDNQNCKENVRFPSTKK